MAEVGGLLVNLGLDVAQIKQDVGKANRELSGFRNQVNRQMGKAQRSVKRLTSGFKGLIAVMGGAALVRSISRTADELENVNRMAKALGAGRGTIQELTFAFRQFNLDQNDVSDALGTLSDRAQDAMDGMKSFQEDFALVGISVEDLRNKRPGELLELFARKISTIEDPTQRTAAAVRIFGDDLGRKLLPMLMEGERGLEKYAEQAREVGAVQSDEMVKSGAEAAKTFRELREVLSAQFTRAVAANAEELKALAEGMIAVGEAAVKYSAAIQEFFNADAFDENVDRATSRARELRGELDRLREEFVRVSQQGMPSVAAGVERRMEEIRRQMRQMGEDPMLGGPGFNQPGSFNVIDTGDGGTGGGGVARSQMRASLGIRGAGGFGSLSAPSLDAVARAARRANEELDKSRPKWEEYQDGIEGTNQAANQLSMTFSSAFEDAIVKGNDLRSVMQGLLEDVQRIFVRQTMTKPLGNMLASAFAGAFTSGAGMMSDPTPGTAGRASGGPVSGGQTYMVGERGPELFTPRNSGQITPNDRLGGGSVTYNIDARGADQAAVDRLFRGLDQVNGSIERRAVTAVRDEQVRRGGRL